MYVLRVLSPWPGRFGICDALMASGLDLERRKRPVLAQINRESVNHLVLARSESWAAGWSINFGHSILTIRAYNSGLRFGPTLRESAFYSIFRSKSSVVR